MSKKIMFGAISQETVSHLNQLSEVLFVSAFEGRNLYNEGTIARNDRVKAEKDGKEDLSSYDKAVRRVQYKQKAMASFRRETLFDHKDDDGNTVFGLFSVMGIDESLYSAYLLMQNEDKRGAYYESIKKVLSNMGIDVKENLSRQLANSLSVAVGRSKTGRNQQVKGEFTKDASRVSFQETFALRLLEQVAKTCPDVVVYNAEFYTATVEYDKNVKFVSYSIQSKAEQAETETEEKAEKKSA